MLAAVLEIVVDAVLSAIGWLVRVTRGLFADAAVDASATREMTGSGEMTGSRRDRRRVRRHFKKLAVDGHTDELVRLYRSLGRDEEFRDLRIDALRELAAHDPAVAEDVLREVIEGADDTWVVLGALDAAAKYHIFGLTDVIAQVTEDHRPAVASYAASAHKRLQKKARRPNKSAA
ncbi:MAG: hypothetical protein MSC31_10785 [Solirubrobacteraceae bacterium MAG38_C4-C5]|nr:hypothetical protein [Candidatus Siliceabacter maunaloa]